MLNLCIINETLCSQDPATVLFCIQACSLRCPLMNVWIPTPHPKKGWLELSRDRPWQLSGARDIEIMESRDKLLDRLSALLAENGVGLGRLTPRPRGGRLSPEAREELEHLLAGLEAGEAIEASMLYGNGCFAVNRYDQASTVYQRILESEPHHQDVRFNLGLAYLRSKRLEEAARQFTAVIDLNSTLAEAYYQRGNVHHDLGENDLALSDYGHAIGSDPEYLQAYYNRAVVLARLGRHTEALEDFDRVIVLRPTLSSAYLNRGASLDELGWHEQAISDYTAALQHDPSNADAFFNRARTNYYLGRLDDTVSDYSQVVELSPKDAEAFNNRGLAFDSLGDYRQAIDDYGEALTLRPEFAEARSNLGAALEALGVVDEALGEYLAAVDIDADFAAAHYNAARLYAQSGNLESCEHHLERAMHLVPQFREEASEDDSLGWVMKLRRLKENRPGPNSEDVD